MEGGFLFLELTFAILNTHTYTHANTVYKDLDLSSHSTLARFSHNKLLLADHFNAVLGQYELDHVIVVARVRIALAHQHFHVGGQVSGGLSQAAVSRQFGHFGFGVA